MINFNKQRWLDKLSTTASGKIHITSVLLKKKAVGTRLFQLPFRLLYCLIV